MSTPDTYPEGETLDNGRYQLEKLLYGARLDGWWSGRKLGPEPCDVMVTIRRLDYSDLLGRALTYEVDGIAPLLFVGSLDGYKAPSVTTNLSGQLCVIEARPAGKALAAAEKLCPEEVVGLGLSLCATIRAWSASGTITRGLRPETVFVTETAQGHEYSGATPRAHFLLGGDESPFELPYDPPSNNDFIEISADDEAFTVGLLLWFAALHEHPYDIGGSPVHNNTWTDKRRTFAGTRELGTILERVLVADAEHRMKLDELDAELVRLGRTWRVPTPMFPPASGSADGPT